MAMRCGARSAAHGTCSGGRPRSRATATSRRATVTRPLGASPARYTATASAGWSCGRRASAAKVVGVVRPASPSPPPSGKPFTTRPSREKIAYSNAPYYKLYLW